MVMNLGCVGVDLVLLCNCVIIVRNCCMGDYVLVFRFNLFLEYLFGGNMLEGMFKVVIWVVIFSVLLVWIMLC